MFMRAGIIGAMEAEVAILKNKLTKSKTVIQSGFTFYQGDLNGSEVILVQSGIGKVAAALATAFLIDKFQPDYVVNTGSAGGFEQSLKVGDIVISSQVRYHDVDVTAFGYEKGQLPNQPAAYVANSMLVDAAQKSALLLNDIKSLVGLITTGDTFMTDETDVNKAKMNFPDMVAVEMEGAAIAHTCHHLDVPFVIIRSLSDIAGKESPTSFDAYLEKASINSSQLVENMVEHLKQQQSLLP
jgi:adenosylhomocysteine nucleosidase